MDSLQKRRRLLSIRKRSNSAGSSGRLESNVSSSPRSSPLRKRRGSLGLSSTSADSYDTDDENGEEDLKPIRGQRSLSPTSHTAVTPLASQVSRVLQSDDDSEEDKDNVYTTPRERKIGSFLKDREEEDSDKEWSEIVRRGGRERRQSTVQESLVVLPKQPAWLRLLEGEKGFFIGCAFGAMMTAIVLISTLSPIPTSYGTKGCALPFRAWNVKLSRVDVVVEITAHTTHIHLPFLLYVLTHNVPWTITGIFICEAAEWINNALKFAELHMYDDPLDDLLQGLVGLVWAMAFVEVHGWRSIEKSIPLRKKLILHCYAWFYSLTCSAFMASAWYIPRRVGLSAYTIWASGGVRWIGWFQPDWEYDSVVLSFVTFFYGVIMMLTEEMYSQNLGLVAFMITTVAAGPAMRSSEAAKGRREVFVRAAKWSVSVGWLTMALAMVVGGFLFVGKELEDRKVCKVEGEDFFLCWGPSLLKRMMGQEKGMQSGDSEEVFLYPIPQFESLY